MDHQDPHFRTTQDPSRSLWAQDDEVVRIAIALGESSQSHVRCDLPNPAEGQLRPL